MGGVGMLGGGPGLELPHPWIMRNCVKARSDMKTLASADIPVVKRTTFPFEN